MSKIDDGDVFMPPTSRTILTCGPDDAMSFVGAGVIAEGPRAGDFAMVLLDESGAPAGMENLTRLVMNLTAKVDELLAEKRRTEGGGP